MQGLLHEKDSGDIDQCRDGDACHLEQPHSMQLSSKSLTSVNRFMN